MRSLPDESLALARQLRQRQTDPERLLWELLRDRRLGGFKFRRQKPFPPYVVDFYCAASQLAIEVDGGQHNEPCTAARDRQRTDALKAHGVRVLRFWNNEVVRQPEQVIEAIWRALTRDGNEP